MRWNNILQDFKGTRLTKKQQEKMLRPSIEAKIGRFAYAVTKLMERTKVPAFIGKKEVKLEAEQILSIEFADKLRELAKLYVDSKKTQGLCAVWFHVPNEGNRNWFTCIVLRAMGLIPGAYDFCFLGYNNSGVIELKVNGELSDMQEFFETWCIEVGVKKAIHRNVAGALETLKKWGMIL